MAITEKTLDFLAQNRLQNSREWYQAHKPQYRQLVLEPLVQLVQDLDPTMRKIDLDLITTAKVDKTISRIYRDTRFSKDKSLYRDVMWCVFTRDRKENPYAPGFFFEFSPRDFRYGCGYYESMPKIMEKMRELILQDDPAFLKADAAYKKQKLFAMNGDVYKRAKHSDHPAQDWLNRKNLYFTHDSMDFALLCSDDLAKVIGKGFEMLAPMYEFFCKVQKLV